MYFEDGTHQSHSTPWWMNILENNWVPIKQDALSQIWLTFVSVVSVALVKKPRHSGMLKNITKALCTVSWVSGEWWLRGYWWRWLNDMIMSRFNVKSVIVLILNVKNVVLLLLLEIHFPALLWHKVVRYFLIHVLAKLNSINFCCPFISWAFSQLLEIHAINVASELNDAKQSWNLCSLFLFQCLLYYFLRSGNCQKFELTTEVLA